MQIKTYHIYFDIKDKSFYKIDSDKLGFSQKHIDERVESFVPAHAVENIFKACTKRYKAIAKR